MRFLISLILFASCSSAVAQRFAQTSGAWNSVTWTSDKAGAVPALVPTAADDVYTNGQSITIGAGTFACRNLFISHDNTSSLIIQNGRTLTVNGTMTGWDDTNDATPDFEEFPIAGVISYGGITARIVFTGSSLTVDYTPYVIFFWDSSSPLGRTAFQFTGSRSTLFDLAFTQNLTISSGTFVLENPIVGTGATLSIAAGATLTGSSNNISFPTIAVEGTVTSSNISGVTDLNIASTGTLSLTGAMSSTNITVDGSLISSSTVTASTNFTLNSTGIANLNGPVSAPNLTVNGNLTASSTIIAGTNLTVNSTGQINTSNTITAANTAISGIVTTSSSLNTTGNFTLGSNGLLTTTFSGGTQTSGWWSNANAPGGSISLSSSSTVNFSASANQNIPLLTFGNLTVSGTGIKTVAGTGTLALTGTLTNSSAAVTFSVPTQDVVFTGTAAQGISGSGTINFASGLEIDKTSGTVTLNRAITVATGLVITSGTLNLGSQTLTLTSGNISNSGTFTPASSTVVINGATQIQGSGVSFNNLTIGASGTFTAPSGILNIEGNLTNNGTNASFVANSGTLLFNGATDQSISGTVTVNNLTASNSGTNGLGVTGTVNLLGTFNLSSGLFDADGIGMTSGVFVVRSTGIGSGGRIGTLSAPSNFSGNVTIERYIDAPEDYRYLSIPITNGNLGMWQDDFAITGNFSNATTPAQNPNVVNAASASVFTFNGATQAYVPVGSGGTTASHNLSNTTGYIAWGYNSSDFVLDVTGTIGKGTVNITGLAANQFNLIPNPFPSAIDWDGITNTNFSNSMFMTTAQGAFATYSRTGVGVNHPDANWTGQIALGQCFWVQSINGSGTSLSIPETAKVNTYEFVREDAPDDYFKIKLVTGNQSDELGIVFRTGATLGIDHDFDALKRSNPPGMINFSSYIENPVEEFAINVIPLIQCNQTVKLKMSEVTLGQYTIKFSDLDKIQLGYQVSLKDNFLNQEVSVDNTIEYVFDVTASPASKADSRFEIHITSPQVDPSLELGLIATQECNNPLVRVAFGTTQPGIKYVLKAGDVNLHEPIVGNGQSAYAFVPKTMLNIGVNHLSMIASTIDGCNAQIVNDAVAVNLHEVNEITTVSTGQTCGDGSVTLSAGGASADGTYRWYESINAIEPIPSATGSQYSTPVLTENKTYHVTAVNAIGCESFTRMAVEARVVKLATPVVNADGYMISTESQGEYQWMKDGVAIEGATSSSYEVKTSGLYSVIVTSHDCQVASEEIEFLITDVEDQSGRSGFTAYPNPTEGLVNISGNGLDLSEITVYQLNGRKIFAHNPELSQNGQQAKVDLTSSRKGIYLIQIRQNNKVVQLKVLKK
jgi:hypothetical protein